MSWQESHNPSTRARWRADGCRPSGPLETSGSHGRAAGGTGQAVREAPVHCPRRLPAAQPCYPARARGMVPDPCLTATRAKVARCFPVKRRHRSACEIARGLPRVLEAACAEPGWSARTVGYCSHPQTVFPAGHGGPVQQRAGGTSRLRDRHINVSSWLCRLRDSQVTHLFGA